MHQLHYYLIQAHIGIGLIAIIVFWIPIATRKGSRLHRKAGTIYSWAMYAVACSAFIMCLMVLFDPIGVRVPSRDLDPERASQIAGRSRQFAMFLLMLSLLVTSGLRHGLLALTLKTNPDAFRSPVHKTLVASLGIMGIVVGFAGYQAGSLLLMIFAVISVSASFSLIKDIRKRVFSRKEALYAHFNGLIGTGVGAYTAVFAFGGSRLLSQFLTGQWQVIPWVAPAIIGTIAISWLKRRNNTGTTA